MYVYIYRWAVRLSHSVFIRMPELYRTTWWETVRTYQIIYTALASRAEYKCYCFALGTVFSSFVFVCLPFSLTLSLSLCVYTFFSIPSSCVLSFSFVLCAFVLGSSVVWWAYERTKRTIERMNVTNAISLTARMSANEMDNAKTNASSTKRQKHIGQTDGIDTAVYARREQSMYYCTLVYVRDRAMPFCLLFIYF